MFARGGGLADPDLNQISPGILKLVDVKPKVVYILSQYRTARRRTKWPSTKHAALRGVFSRHEVESRHQYG
jgi:hypothetical protein